MCLLETIRSFGTMHRKDIKLRILSGSHSSLGRVGLLTCGIVAAYSTSVRERYGKRRRSSYVSNTPTKKRKTYICVGVFMTAWQKVLNDVLLTVLHALNFSLGTHHIVHPISIPLARKAISLGFFWRRWLLRRTG